MNLPPAPVVMLSLSKHLFPVFCRLVACLPQQNLPSQGRGQIHLDQY